ncbi:MAG TPA: hypothetical protein VJT73_20265, partial [Polyangiaceae bacterium]|nr:hypothetical protein [Polyangiaceae bacterium]
VFFGYDACGIRAHEVAPAPAAPEPLFPTLARAGAALREIGAAAFFVVCAVALSQGMTDETHPMGASRIVHRIVGYARIYQTWGLFAPDPPTRQGTIIVDGQTVGGKRVDPVTGDVPRQGADALSAAPKSRHPLMSAYFSSISQPARQIYVDGFRDYLNRISEKGDSADRVYAYTASWVEGPIAPPSPAPQAPPSEGAEASISSRRITARP